MTRKKSRKRGSSSRFPPSNPAVEEEAAEEEVYDETALTSSNVIQSSTIRQELICGQHSFPFNIWRTRKQRRGVIHDCEGDMLSETHSAVHCSSSREAQRYYASFKSYGAKVFRPLLGFQQIDGSVILIGQYSGNTQKWIDKVKSKRENFWSVDGYGGLTHEVKWVGKQILTMITTCHQDKKYIGNLLGCLNIDPDTSRVTFTQFSQENYSLKDGIERDLKDFRQFMNEIKPKATESNPVDPIDFALFEALFPAIYPNDVKALQGKSYIICHCALFWGFKERYNFIRKLSIFRKKNNTSFTNCVKLKSGRANMENWQKKLPSDKNLPLRAVYEFRGNDSLIYDEPVGIIRFIRNTFAHYHAHDPKKSLQEIDKEILKLYPDAYSKIYYEVGIFLHQISQIVGNLLNVGSDPLNYSRY